MTHTKIVKLVNNKLIRIDDPAKSNPEYIIPWNFFLLIQRIYSMKSYPFPLFVSELKNAKIRIDDKLLRNCERILGVKDNMIYLREFLPSSINEKTLESFQENMNKKIGKQKWAPLPVLNRDIRLANL